MMCVAVGSTLSGVLAINRKGKNTCACGALYSLGHFVHTGPAVGTVSYIQLFGCTVSPFLCAPTCRTFRLAWIEAQR